MAEVTDVRAIRGDLLEDQGEEEDPVAASGYVVPRGVEVFEINGPFFFGAAETFKDTIGRVAGKPKVLIIRLRLTPVMDATGLHALTEVVHRSRREGTLVLLSELQPQPLATLSRSALLEEIGEENLCPTVEAALSRAREELELQKLLGRGSGQREIVA
jgi:sulfate permease, SulP family